MALCSPMTHLIGQKVAGAVCTSLQCAAGLSEPIPAFVMLSIGVRIAPRPGRAALRPGSGPVLVQGRSSPVKGPVSTLLTPVKLHSDRAARTAQSRSPCPLALQLCSFFAPLSPQVRPVCSLHPFQAGG